MASVCARQCGYGRKNKMKLDQLRNDIQAEIASGDAGTLDADEIKRRGRTWHGDALDPDP